MSLTKFNKAIIVIRKPMNLLAKISVLIFCIILSILLITPLMLDNSSLKFHIEQKISQKLDSNFEVKDGINISFLPGPKIILHNVNLNNLKDGKNIINLHVKNLTMGLDFFSLLKRKVKINKLIFESPQMELAIDRSFSTNNQKDQKPDDIKNIAPIKAMLTDEIFSFKDVTTETLSFKNIEQITVKDGSFFKFSSDKKAILEFKKIEFGVKNNIEKNIFNINGSFLADEISTDFKMVINAANSNDSELVVSSPILKINLKGKFNNSEMNNLAKANFSGKFDAEIINLKAVLNKYFSKKSLIYNKINNIKPIKISCDIESRLGEIKAHNLVINSQIISGNGQIEANFSTSKPTIDIDIMLANIDIDSIWLSSVSNKSNISELENNIASDFINSQNQNPDATKIIKAESSPENKESTFNNIDLTADIKVKNAKYLDGELKDISLYFILGEKGKVLLQPLIMKVPGNGTLRINGAFENENEVPKFIGKIDTSGKNLQQFLSWLKIKPQNLKPESLADYNIITDILLLPDFIVLSNFYGALNNNKNLISGNIKIDNSNSTPRINSDFKINDLNVEDYFLISNQNQYLSRGSLLKKLLWLNSTTSSGSLNLFFNKLTYKQNSFYNQPINMEFRQGYYKLSDLQLKSDDINVKGYLNINLTGNNPIIDIKLDAENFNYISKKLEINDIAENEKSAIKPDFPFKSGFIEQFFNLPSFDEFDGTIDINVHHLKADGVKMDDIKIAGTMKSGNLTIKDASLNLYDGSLKYNGIVILKSAKVFNGSFELTNINNQEFLNDLLDINNISGISNISGVVSVAGKDRGEFFQNLDIQLKFISGNVVVKGFGIDDLSRKMLWPQQNKSELKNPSNILFNKNYSTYFQTVAGNLDIRRGNRENKLRIETSTPGINSVTTGTIDLENNIVSGLSNFIFLTGTRQKQIPITISINYNSKSGKIDKNANVDQVNKYLNQ